MQTRESKSKNGMKSRWKGTADAMEHDGDDDDHALRRKAINVAYKGRGGREPRERSQQVPSACAMKEGRGSSSSSSSALAHCKVRPGGG